MRTRLALVLAIALTAFVVGLAFMFGWVLNLS